MRTSREKKRQYWVMSTSTPWTTLRLRICAWLSHVARSPLMRMSVGAMRWMLSRPRCAMSREASANSRPVPSNQVVFTRESST